MAGLDDVIKLASFRAALRELLHQDELLATRHGLTPQRYMLLLMIKGAPDGSQRSTVTELSKSLQVAQHTVTELVARVQRAGLIRREASAADGRVTYLRLTAKGDRLLTASMGDLARHRRAFRDLLAGIRF